jgi:hypothetical protein
MSEEENKPKVSDLVQGQVDSLTGVTEAREKLNLRQIVAQAQQQTEEQPFPQQEYDQAIPVAQTDQAVEEDLDDSEEGLQKTTKAMKTHIQKKLLESNRIMSRTVDLFDTFKPEYYTLGGRVRGAATKMSTYLTGDLDSKDVEYEEERLRHIQGVRQSYAQYKKLISGTAVGVQEAKELKKTVLSENMSPLEARAALMEMAEGTIIYRMSLRQVAKDGFAIGKDADRKRLNKLIDARAKLQGQKLHKFVKEFRKINPGATRAQALKYYMYENNLHGTGGE